VVEDVRRRARGDFGTTCDVDKLRALVAAGAGGALPPEDVGLAVTRAGFRLRAGDVVGDQGRQPVHRVDGAVAVVLGWAAHQLAGVEFVQLPLDADGAGAGELRLQADDFAPAHAGVALEDDCDELVVAAGEQGGALGGQQDAERVGDDLLRATVTGTAGALAASAPPSSRVRGDQALVDRVLEDQVERRAPGLDAGGRVDGLLLLP
jgi:hypothetical protein